MTFLLLLGLVHAWLDIVEALQHRYLDAIELFVRAPFEAIQASFICLFVFDFLLKDMIRLFHHFIFTGAHLHQKTLYLAQVLVCCISPQL